VAHEPRRACERNRSGADGGDALAWVPVQVSGLTLKIPSSDGRRRAVLAILRARV
jgi:hypothetical protein